MHLVPEERRVRMAMEIGDPLASNFPERNMESIGRRGGIACSAWSLE